MFCDKCPGLLKARGTKCCRKRLLPTCGAPGRYRRPFGRNINRDGNHSRWRRVNLQIMVMPEIPARRYLKRSLEVNGLRFRRATMAERRVPPRMPLCENSADQIP